MLHMDVTDLSVDLTVNTDLHSRPLHKGLGTPTCSQVFPNSSKETPPQTTDAGTDIWTDEARYFLVMQRQHFIN